MVVRQYKCDKGSMCARSEEFGIKYVEIGTSVDKKTDSIKYRKVITIAHSPTGNCQMSIAGSFYQILSDYTVDQIVQILPRLKEYFNNRCLLVDIPRAYVPKYLEALKKLNFDIIFHTPYPNTTGSDMDVIYADYHPEWEEEDDEEEYDDEYDGEDDDY